MAEVKKIGNLQERLFAVNSGLQGESTDGPKGGSCVYINLFILTSLSGYAAVRQSSHFCVCVHVSLFFVLYVFLSFGICPFPLRTVCGVVPCSSL